MAGIGFYSKERNGSPLFTLSSRSSSELGVMSATLQELTINLLANNSQDSPPQAFRSADQTVKRKECVLFLRLQMRLTPHEFSMSKGHLRSQDLNICTFFFN